MGEGGVIERKDGAATLFLLSAERADELARLASGAGWRVTGACDPSAFAVSGAAVAVVDACGSVGEGLAAVRELAPAADRTGAALLAILPRSHPGAVDAAFDAGATHFLPSPTTKEEFIDALRFADRFARRLRRRGPPESGRRRGDLVPVAPVGEAVRRWAAERLGAGRSVLIARVALASFDLVNSAHGRAAGDLILGEAAERLNRVAQELFGGRAIVARATGPEFLLAGDAAQAEEEEFAAQIRATLARPFGRALVGSRLGVASSRPDDDAAALMQRAAEALEPDDEGSAEELAVELHHAIGSGQIAVLFQPQVDMASGQIVGVEALARWEHPKLGLIGADALFAAGERAGLGQPLSEHVQRLALNGAACWPAPLRRLRLSLNVTAEDVAGPNFADRLLERVGESGFSARRLTVEVTESGLIGNLDHAAALLGRLREAGCRTAIDDFGTGYSSLSYLNALPLDYLKLDKSLVRGVERDGRERVVAQGVLALARSLGLATIAEGVETIAQRDLLASEGCELFQGFLCSEAIGVERLVGLVA